jgi:hypothetical protein
MPDDDFSDGPADAPAPPQGDDSDPKAEGDDSATGLLPKSVLGGKELKPGDECTLQIVADHGDEYEVKYADQGAEEPQDPDGPGSSPPAAPGGGMESMLQD